MTADARSLAPKRHTLPHQAGPNSLRDFAFCAPQLRSPHPRVPTPNDNPPFSRNDQLIRALLHRVHFSQSILPPLETAPDEAHGDALLHEAALVQLAPSRPRVPAQCCLAQTPHRLHSHAHVGAPRGLPPLLQVRVPTDERSFLTICIGASVGLRRFLAPP